MCPCSKGGQQPPGLAALGSMLPTGRGSDPSCLLSICEATSGGPVLGTLIQQEYGLIGTSLQGFLVCGEAEKAGIV